MFYIRWIFPKIETKYKGEVEFVSGQKAPYYEETKNGELVNIFVVYSNKRGYRRVKQYNIDSYKSGLFIEECDYLSDDRFN